MKTGKTGPIQSDRANDRATEGFSNRSPSCTFSSAMKQPITGPDVTRLAVEAEVSPKVIYSALRGGNVRRASAAAIRTAAARLGWLDRLPGALASGALAAKAA
jgi:hypothetical protein